MLVALQLSTKFGEVWTSVQLRTKTKHEKDVHPSPHQDTAGAHPTETEAEDPLGQVPQYA